MTAPLEKHVEAMFDGIAPRYDLLNRVLSMGVDRRWRRMLVKQVLLQNPLSVLDVATGTADLAIMVAKKCEKVRVTGADIAENMLAVGRRKVERANLSQRIALQKASALSLPFPGNHFDAAMVAFGVRNFENPVLGLREIHRTLKPGGRLLVLEFTNPKGKLFGKLYSFYFYRVLPAIGRLISGHRSAYTYLPNSVKAFAEREAFVNLLSEAGFEKAGYRQLSMGIAALYSASKPQGHE